MFSKRLFQAAAKGSKQTEKDANKPKKELECDRENGADPPATLTGAFHTRLLHELDVLHYGDWRAQNWFLGSGAFAEVHLGRLAATGECVAVKRFSDSSVTSIEREIRIHKYMEQFIPNTPRILGLLPSGRSLQNVSLVFEYVANSQTLHDWKTSEAPVSRIQWLSVVLQMAETLEVMHRKCVLHNDLHSDNVLIAMPGEEAKFAAPSTACGFQRLDRTDSESDEDEVEAEDEGWLSRILSQSGDRALPKVTFIDFGHATFRRGKFFSFDYDSESKSFRHLAPEVLENSYTSRAADVFSLGHQLQDVAEAMNCSALAAIAEECLHEEAGLRPHIRSVVHSLRRLFLQTWRRLTSTNFWDDPELSSTSPPFAFPLIRHLQSTEEPSFPFENYRQHCRHAASGKYFRNCRSSDESVPCRMATGYTETYSTNYRGARNFKPDCSPHSLEDRILALALPYLASTDVKNVYKKANKQLLLSESERGSISVAELTRSGHMVVVKQFTRSSFPEVRYEALINLYLNDTGWVPRFYGVAPRGSWSLRRLGIVQELFAEGVTLGDVLKSGKPVGFAGRVALAVRLSSMLADVHSRYILLNNFNVHNILCLCKDQSHCLDVKIIDVGASCGCDGKILDGDRSYLSEFAYLAPEVRNKQLTSYASDVYSLCVALLDVLDVNVLTKDTNISTVHEVNELLDFTVKWSDVSTACLADDVSLRPTAADLKDFFSQFDTMQ
ncbi:hypothetical protein BaRGS_00005310 [Batillaria attramentaria]|uniref:Protein kinase domain-containing protein n=1 Tax=Batillaria attramentaria TaxID=370345 RepID=A0ABD0LUV7_9CAEN